jgi:hypothetical protein
MRTLTFHARRPGENSRMYRSHLSAGAVAFLVAAFFLCAIVSGAALRAALG